MFYVLNKTGVIILKCHNVHYAGFLFYVLFPRCGRFDGDCVENNPEAVIDKSKPWSRSIEDLHGGSTLPSPITGNGITRAGRHSTLRYGAHGLLWFTMYVCVICNFLRLTLPFRVLFFFFLSLSLCYLVLSWNSVAVL